MEKLLNQILSLASSVQDLQDLHGHLKSAEGNLAKAARSGQVDAVLNQLDPRLHSLGYLYLLGGKAASEIHDGPVFMKFCGRLFENGDELQLRMAGDKFRAVVLAYAKVARTTSRTKAAIRPLRCAIGKIRQDPTFFTPIHAEFVLCCVLAKCYTAAVPVLEQEILQVDARVTKETPKDMLQYFYYGGIAYIGLKQYKRALDFFTLLFTVPAHAASAIHIEAYKKYILASLLAYGKVGSLPKYTPQLVHRHLKAFCGGYQEVATAYGTGSVGDLRKALENNTAQFVKDNNLGLTQQCLQSLTRRNIQRLTQTYITLSLKDIADTCALSSVAEAEQNVLQMIADGEIFATINQRDGMVEFLEDPERYNNIATLARVDAEVRACMELSEKVSRIDEAIALNPAYIHKTEMSDHRGGGAGGMGGDWDMGPMAEDMGMDDFDERGASAFLS